MPAAALILLNLPFCSRNVGTGDHAVLGALHMPQVTGKVDETYPALWFHHVVRAVLHQNNNVDMVHKFLGSTSLFSSRFPSSSVSLKVYCCNLRWQ
jgi:hypothetical protein